MRFQKIIFKEKKFQYSCLNIVFSFIFIFLQIIFHFFFSKIQQNKINVELFFKCFKMDWKCYYFDDFK